MFQQVLHETFFLPTTRPYFRRMQGCYVYPPTSFNPAVISPHIKVKPPKMQHGKVCLFCIPFDIFCIDCYVPKSCVNYRIRYSFVLGIVVVTRLLSRDGGMVEDGGAPEAGQLLRAWTRGCKGTESCQRANGTKSPWLDSAE